MAVFRDMDDHLSDEEQEELLAVVIRRKLVVLPTDTVYGIGADPFSRKAVSRLLQAKGRDQTMPPPILGGNPMALLGLAHFDNERQEHFVRRLAARFWPGPLSIVVKAGREVGWDTSSVNGTIALRMPAHPVSLAVLRATGPLAVTSANRTGMVPAQTVEEAREYFGDEVAIYVDGGVASSPVPSTVVDCTGEEPQVIRVGEVTLAEVRELLPSQ